MIELLKEIAKGVTLFQKRLSYFCYLAILPGTFIYLKLEDALTLVEFLSVVLAALTTLWVVNLGVALINRLYIHLGYGGEEIQELNVFNKGDLSQLKNINKMKNTETLLKGFEKLDDKDSGYLLFLSPLERFIHLFSFLVFCVSFIILCLKVGSLSLDWDSVGGWLAVNGFGLTIFYSAQTQGKSRLNKVIQSLKDKIHEEIRIKNDKKLDVLLQKITTMDKRIKKANKK